MPPEAKRPLRTVIFTLLGFAYLWLSGNAIITLPILGDLDKFTIIPAVTYLLPIQYGFMLADCVSYLVDLKCGDADFTLMTTSLFLVAVTLCVMWTLSWGMLITPGIAVVTGVVVIGVRAMRG